jgi:predicted CoA-binding protein
VFGGPEHLCSVAAAGCVAGSIDILDVFRKPSDLPPHLEDILAAKPAAVWLQSGITNQAFEENLAKAGIKVVSDRCLMVDHRQAAASSRM